MKNNILCGRLLGRIFLFCIAALGYLWADHSQNRTQTVEDKTVRKLFKHDRLWRDTMIEQWRNQGHLVNQGDSLTDEAFQRALLDKLVEETDEVVHAKTAQEVAKELADVYEVIDTIIKAYALSKADIIEYQNQKRADRGTFTKDSFVKTFSPVEGSDQEVYCLRNVHRAPQIIQ